MGKFEKPKEIQNTDHKKRKEQKKQTRKYIRLVIISVVVALLAVMPMLASRNQGAADTGASILSATVENKTIETQIIGGGQLSSEASLNVRIPENVKLMQYLVGNGDVVLKGDPIARVDKVSVMTAITQVQETLDYLADEIADASAETASTSVKALAGGTVKVIYAKEGESVQDVMLAHGALAVLSLDDTMAVKIERETTLDVGDTVCVTFSDGTEADGRVKANLEGVLTITLDDDDYSVGAKVTVTTEDGDRLGTGELYIFSAWSATAYSGTVSDILVEENASVYIGQSMFSLENTGNSAQFQRLIDQRQEYEELMQELFTMYRTETISAPCDGIVTGVDEDGAYLLSDDGKGWFATLLSFFGKEENSGFIAYAAQVTAEAENGMALRIDPNMIEVSELTELAAISVDLGAMTKEWYYVGDTRVYTQSTDGLLHSAGNAKVGDILLAVGDEESVHWFVLLNGSGQNVQVTQTNKKQSEIVAFLLSDSEDYIVVCTSNEACEATEHNSDCPKYPVQPDVCTGAEGCSASEHNDGCPMKNDEDGNQDISLFDEGDDSNGDGTDGEDGSGDDPITCTGAENCLATNHNDGCLSQQSDDTSTTVSITTTALNQGTVGIAYYSGLQASDGITVLSGTWAVTGLPTGLTMDSATGTISGTPLAADSYTVSVTFTGSDNATAIKEFPLVIVENTPVLQITTTSLGTGVVGQTYSYPMQVSGSDGGTWTVENLPGGLVVNEQTGVISGTPTAEGSYTVKVTYTDAAGESVAKEYTLKIVTAEATVYTGYVAQIVEVKDGWAKVKQTLYSYTITDLTDLPKVSATATELTVEKEYTSDLIKGSELTVGDMFLIVVNNKGNVTLISKEAVQVSQETPGQGGGNAGNSTGGGTGTGGGGGMTGGGAVSVFETYSLSKLTVASVTSQEHMTVSITIDELDITKIYVGQAAIVSVDALGGEQFDAEITRISNSGENDGGNSKFTVEVTLGKSGDMLPGMYSSAFIKLYSTVDVPCVPVSALDKEGADTIVYTSYDAEKGVLGNPVVVTIGASDGENVQVVSGMGVGDACYYEYYDTYVGSNSPQQQASGFNIGRMLGGR